MVSVKWYARKVYNERMCTIRNVPGDEDHVVIEWQSNTYTNISEVALHICHLTIGENHQCLNLLSL